MEENNVKEVTKKIEEMVKKEGEISGFLMMFSEEGNENHFQTVAKDDAQVIFMLLNLLYDYTTSEDNHVEWQKDDGKEVVRLNEPMAEALNEFCCAVLAGDKKTQEDVKNVMRNLGKVAKTIVSTIENNQDNESEEK